MHKFLPLALCCAVSLAPLSARAQNGHADSLNRLKGYHYGGDGGALDAVAQWVNASRPDAAQRKSAAADLASLLTMDATPEAKQFACRQLVLIAGQEQVPALAGLLGDEQLAHYALMVLQQIPGTAVDAALHTALPQSHGATRAEIMDTMGERHDFASVPLLAEQLRATEPGTAEAAAAALAKIPAPEVLPPLRQAYSAATGELRIALGRSLLAAADRLRLAGDASAGGAYRLIYADPASAALAPAALQGLTAADRDRGLPLLLEALGKDGSPLQTMAAALARDLPPATAGRLAARLPQLSATGQLLLLGALADRADPTPSPAMLSLARAASGPVQVAALNALGASGDAAAVPLLLQVAADGAPEARDAARAALARLKGQPVDARLLQMLDGSAPKVAVEAISALGQRGVPAALPRLVRAAGSPQPGVSAAAVRVLREMGQPADLPVLLRLLPGAPEERRAELLSTVAAIARRGSDDQQRTGAILSGLNTATAPAERVELLTIVGQVGGPRALAALRQSMGDKLPEVRLAALRGLADWPTDEPLNDLLAVVRGHGDERSQAIALRGYLRMLGTSEHRSPEAALAAYREAAAMATTADAKRQLLAGVAKLGTLPALQYAATFVRDKEVGPEAEFAVIELGHATAGAWREQTRAALEPIVKNSTVEAARTRARDTLTLLDKFGDFVTAWEVSPAYQKDGANAAALFDLAFEPEDPAHAKDVNWRSMPVGTSAEQPWLLDLLALWGGEQRVAYLRTAVWSDAVRDLVLELGSDDGVKAWWNGAVVHANNTQRALIPGQDKVKLHAEKGWNPLLLKITQNNMGWAACARFTNPDGSPAAGLRYALPSSLPAPQ